MDIMNQELVSLQQHASLCFGLVKEEMVAQQEKVSTETALQSYHDEVDYIVCHEDFPKMIFLAKRIEMMNHSGNTAELPSTSARSAVPPLTPYSDIVMDPVYRIRKEISSQKNLTISRGMFPQADSLMDESIAALEAELSRCEQHSKPRKQVSKHQKWQIDMMMEWIIEHKDKPYPSKIDIENLSEATQLSEQQIVNWFTNVRKRKIKTHKKEGKDKRPNMFLDFLFICQARDEEKQNLEEKENHGELDYKEYSPIFSSDKKNQSTDPDSFVPITPPLSNHHGNHDYNFDATPDSITFMDQFVPNCITLETASVLQHMLQDDATPKEEEYTSENDLSMMNQDYSVTSYIKTIHDTKANYLPLEVMTAVKKENELRDSFYHVLDGDSDCDCIDVDKENFDELHCKVFSSDFSSEKKNQHADPDSFVPMTPLAVHHRNHECKLATTPQPIAFADRSTHNCITPEVASVLQHMLREEDTPQQEEFTSDTDILMKNHDYSAISHMDNIDSSPFEVMAGAAKENLVRCTYQHVSNDGSNCDYAEADADAVGIGALSYENVAWVNSCDKEPLDKNITLKESMLLDAPAALANDQVLGHATMSFDLDDGNVNIGSIDINDSGDVERYIDN